MEDSKLEQHPSVKGLRAFLLGLVLPLAVYRVGLVSK